MIQLHPQLQIDASEPPRSPGLVLREDYMAPHKLYAPQLARRAGIAVTRLRRIMWDAAPIGAKDALRLAAALDTSALYWLLLQARHDLGRIRRTTARYHPE